MAETMKIRKRSEIPVEDTWAVEDLYVTDEAWEAELQTIENDKQTIAAYAGRLVENPETLYSYLQLSEELDVKISKLANYIMRKADVDTRNSLYQGMSGKFRGIMVALGAALSFETPEIMAISDETLDGFYASCPKLERYRRYLTNMRRRKAHTLSAAEEKLLAAAGGVTGAPTEIYNLFSNADMTFADAVDAEGNNHPLRQGNFVSLQENTDRQLRRSAYENLYSSFGNFKNTAAAGRWSKSQ